ncbi:MAG: MarC family protein [Candidatus Margulisiibacteriota bacterium]
MDFNWYGLLQAVTALFVITDPLGNLPIFMGLTDDLDEKERLKQFISAVVFGFILLSIFALFGSLILNIFHITLRDFKIAGGILLLAIAIMLLVRGHHKPEGAQDVGVMPMGCPLLVGPGAITTTMVLIGTVGFVATAIAVVINFFLSFMTLYWGEVFYNKLGGPFFKAISRVMVIIIAAIAVQFISDGIIELVRHIQAG